MEYKYGNHTACSYLHNIKPKPSKKNPEFSIIHPRSTIAQKTMSSNLSILFLLLLHSSTIIITLASDPDPVSDFCIPATISETTCKNSSLATVEDFVFSGIKHPGKFTETGLASIPVNVKVFPGLNSLGMSLVRADFEVGGVNVPHLHPRATEVAYVLEGKIYSGFVDTQNKIFAKVIERGEVMVFPRGLVHFQMNVGDSRATILGSFDSQNPGLMKIPSAVFGSEIEEELLVRAFGLSPKEIAKLRKKLGPH
ncbi:germin-like protein subfamily 3 member 2 [Mangifera indica]|uniref:germin-like protein subfamily 3 member 2 n=1 Tax=Mangifera indica TaxID=29780 RepID=UPI001CFA1599|nr:germin-like protein subfamily 3 member 2 [Mangifera indica]